MSIKRTIRQLEKIIDKEPTPDVSDPIQYLEEWEAWHKVTNYLYNKIGEYLGDRFKKLITPN